MNTKQRPRILSFLGILNILFGILVILWNVFVILAITLIKPRSSLFSFPIFLTSLWIRTFLSILFIFSGIGLLKLAKWGRWLTISTAVLSLISILAVSLLILINLGKSLGEYFSFENIPSSLLITLIVLPAMILLKSIYPILLLILLNIKSIKETFKK